MKSYDAGLMQTSSHKGIGFFPLYVYEEDTLLFHFMSFVLVKHVVQYSGDGIQLGYLDGKRLFYAIADFIVLFYSGYQHKI